MVQSFNVSATKPSDVQLSPDGSKLYSAGSDGILRVYELKTGALIHSWQIGVKLGGMDISPDGSFLMVVEREPVSTTGNASGRLAIVTIYKVDTATGQATSYPFQAVGYDYTFFDVAVLSNGKALITQDFSGSGWVQLKLLDLATGQYGTGPEVRQSSILTRSPTGDSVLIGESNISNAQLDLYRTGTGIVAGGNAGGFNFGIQAFSATGDLSANYIYNEGIRIYDGSLHPVITLQAAPGGDWRNGRASGVVFDAAGEYLFVLDNVANTLVKIRTSDWSVVGSIPVGADVGGWTGGSFGNRLILDPLARYFSVVTDGGLVLVANPEAPAMMGTAAADTIEGTLFPDVVNGLGGDDTIDTGGSADTLDGGAGADTLRGGADDDIYVVDDAGDVVEENEGEGTDEVRTSLASASLAAYAKVENLTGTLATGQILAGNSGNNVVTGGAGNDVLRLDGGGDDTVNAGAGNDNIFFIGALTSADVVDGGAGVDTLVLQGPYDALTLTANITQIENISILGGNNTNFGEPGTNRYDYSITTNDLNFAAGVQARINGSALLEGEDFTFNGSAETNASFVVYGGKGVDTLTGGLGNDIFFYAEERFASGDTVNGGAGYDGMFLRGNYTIDFNAPGYTGLFTNIENLTLTSATDERYARGGGTEFDYILTLSDALVGAGQTLTVSGALLMATETMILDGSLETNGILRLFGGKAADILKGGAQADYLHGNLGADTLSGGGGEDLFRYDNVAESNSGSTDHILDFTPGTDRMELSRIDADTLVGGDQAFSWIGSSAFTGSAGELRAFESGGSWFVEGDTNGDSVADLVIQLTLQGPMPLGAGDFVL